MPFLKKTVIPLTVAVAVAALAMGGLQTMRETPPAPVAPPAYNALAEGVDLRVFDAAGQLGYALQAAQQTRFSDNRIEWRRPSLQWYGVGGANWRVEADSGVSRANGESLNLSGNVVLRRDGDGDGDQNSNAASLIVTTTSLDVDLPGEFVSTAAPVEMTSGPLRQRATGLELNLAADSLRLLGDVKGSHARF